MHILGKQVILRAIEEADLEVLHSWANDPSTQDIMGAIHWPSSLDFHKEWFKKLKHDQSNQRFAIEVPDLGLIGVSSIIDIDWRNSHAWHGVMLGNVDIRGKGYGKDAVMATMRYAFDELNLRRLDGQMVEYNQGSVDFYCNKLGWKKEGVRRDWIYRKGRFWDQIVVGVTKNDYEQLVKDTCYWDVI
jgi:RimJ/RimL family protein N-acetyltransferase